MRTIVTASLLSAGVSLAAMAAPALAQAAPSSGNTTPETNTAGAVVTSVQDGASTTDGAGSDIVVTGSRIVRSGASAPTPVTIISAEQLALGAPSNIPDGLNQLPQFAGSRNQTQSPLSNANTPATGNYLNLRNIGQNRVLVLLDGRRVPPTSFEGTVDTNTLPQALVQRVDVVTAGASAVYGADAVSGVVNFVLDKDLEGIKGSVQDGISGQGDNHNYRVSLAGGFHFAGDRGRILLSAEHFKSEGVPHKSDRSWYNPIWFLSGTGTAASPYTVVANGRNVGSSYGGLVTSGPLSGQQFTTGGALAPFTYGAVTGTSNARIGGDGVIGAPESSLAATLRTDQVFGYADFQLTDDVRVFAQGTYAQSESVYSNLYDVRTGATALTIFSGNAFLSPAQQAQLTANNTASFTMARMSRDLGVLETDTNNYSLNGTIGLEGDLGSFKWDAFYTYGRSILRTEQPQVNNQRFFAALDSVKDSSGNAVCRVSITNPGLYPGCAPLNLLGEGSPSQAAMAYIYGTSRFRVLNELHQGSASISGKAFSTWAGPVSVALSGEFREASLAETSNSDPAQTLDTTGLRGLPSSRLLPYFFTNVGVAKGSYHVWEGAVETVIPLAKDLPLLKSLEFNGAYRLTDYSTSGTVSTWKLGFSWEPFDGLRFRGTRSRDIRAPTLYDLYAGRQIQSNVFTDTGVTGLSSGVPFVTGGNLDLKPEKGDTWSFGAIVQPAAISGLTASVDYFNLNITDAITTLNATNVRDQCNSSGGTDALCALIIRPGPTTDTSASNFPTSINLSTINLAQLKVRGIDIELGYRLGLSSISSSLGSGSLSFRGLATYLLEYTSFTGLGAHRYDASGIVGNPHWRGTLSGIYSSDGFQLYAQGRFIGRSVRDRPSYLGFVYARNTVPLIVYGDLTLTQKVGPVTPFFTINNVFDTKPPIVPSTFNAGSLLPTDYNTYDVIGRTFTVGVRFKL